MALDPTVALGALILIAVAAVTLFLAFRHRLAFRIAMRDVRRGRARTALLIAGLLIGTTIISGSLIVGDTVQQLSVHYTYLGAGYVDESISGTSPSGGLSYYPYAVYTQTSTLVSGHSSIAGVTPEIIDGASTYDVTTGIPETALNLIGVNGNQSAALGSFVADNGTTLAGPSPGQVLIDDQTAIALNASVGDTLVTFGLSKVPLPLTVEAIVQENVRGAFITAGLSPGNLFVTLADAQILENASGRINYIAVTNTGSQADGASSSSSVAGYLNTTLASVLSVHSLTVNTPLSNALASARTGAQNTFTIFLVLGLFSIAAGAMLIVGIFVMLAEERKGEMGMLRAIGLRRQELVYTFYFEGVAYAAGSALAGTALGVGVGYFLVYLAGFILSGEGIPSGAIVQSFTVTEPSLVIAYVAGFLLTLITVILTSARVSRLNIVRAIRDVPEPRPPVRTYTFLAYLGGVLFLGGGLLFLDTYRGATDLSYPLIGGALTILGAGLIAARFFKNRPVFSIVGLMLFGWAGWVPLHEFLLGSGHTGGIFIVFVEGIIMVGGVLMVFLFNAPLLARLLARLFGRRADSSPVVRVGLSYPTRQATRTVVSLTIFSLVVFTMVATAAFGATLQTNLDSVVTSDSGGYSFFGASQTPIPNLSGQIASNASLAPLFTNSVSVIDGAVHVTVPGYSANPYTDTLFAAPSNASPSSNFYDTNQFKFSSTLNGTSTAATFQEITGSSTDAIVDQNYAPPTTTIVGGRSGALHPYLSVGAVIELATLNGSRAVNVTVVGILKETALTGVWVSPATAARLGVVNATLYLMTVASGVSTTHAAQLAKKAFFRWNLVLYDLKALIAQSINTTEGFIGLLEIFVGLGLAVGIAAMGILALRAVVERRREIGMLRATGFTQRMVLRSFILEYSFVTVLGVGIGTVLGLLIVYNLTTSSTAATAGITQFGAPWLTVVEIVVVAYLLVLVAILGPSLRAARMPPAEAVRTTE
jgi:putative ABC transport system permease protein